MTENKRTLREQHNSAWQLLVEEATQLKCALCKDPIGYIADPYTHPPVFCAWCKRHPSEAVR